MSAWNRAVQGAPASTGSALDSHLRPFLPYKLPNGGLLSTPGAIANQHLVSAHELALLDFLRGQPQELFWFLSNFPQDTLPPAVRALREELENVVVEQAVNAGIQAGNGGVGPAPQAGRQPEENLNGNDDEIPENNNMEEEGAANNGAENAGIPSDNSDDDSDNSDSSADDPLYLPGGGLNGAADNDRRKCKRNAASRQRRDQRARARALVRKEKSNPYHQEPQQNHSNGQHIVENDGRAVAEHQVLQDRTIHLLSELCAFSAASIVDDAGSADRLELHELIRLLIFKDRLDLRRRSSNFQPGSLECMSDVVLGYAKSEALESGMQLSAYLSAVHYAAQVQIWQKQNTELRKADVHRLVVKTMLQNFQNVPYVDESSLRNLYSLGLRIASLIAAATPYVLFLLAVTKVKTALKLLPGTQVVALHHIIRFPDESSLGRQIKQTLIPLMGQLCARYPISWDFLFEDYVAQLGDGTAPLLICDIMACDGIFDCFDFEAFVKERDYVSWSVVLGPSNPEKVFTVNHLLALYEAAELQLMSIGQFIQKIYMANQQSSQDPGDALDLPSFIPDCQWDKKVWDSVSLHPDIITVPTNYQPELNKEVKYGSQGISHREFTDTHRAYVEQRGKSCKTVKELRKKLKAQLATGKKAKIDRYTVVDASVFDGKILQIQDADKNLMALLLANMPEHLRRDLLATLEAVFPDGLQDMDSRQQENPSFDAYHFSYYNRYGKKGTNTPPEADPATIQRLGKQKVHTSQYIPRASEDYRDKTEVVKMLTDSFKPVLDWIQYQLKTLLPDVFDILEVLVDVMPMGDNLPMHPFTGFVVNLNVTTLIHRDKGDKEICIVLQISDCIGGELCLLEPGLVFRLRSGDALIFKSKEMSHFNCHFKGKRSTFVFHTDATMEGWALSRNNWGHNIHMSCSKMS
ncbi:hypothetical protein CVT24_003819 [Panaeolus cyanescens]|uniref:Uncharacterized protein n=1 Tax=Panaeolus cyanescens TaxID=181874 RepID=A0A409YXH0_9AGAR|nr:hypothetical protein CVT24_003819 [Panaeolus cyanescens]